MQCKAKFTTNNKQHVKAKFTTNNTTTENSQQRKNRRNIFINEDDQITTQPAVSCNVTAETSLVRRMGSLP